MSVVKYRLIIAFDGEEFQGWQVQKNHRGVQEEVERALKAIYGFPIRLLGSSRTDTGVHALGMAAHYEIPEESDRFPEFKIALALNSHLPESVRVMNAAKAHPDFHAQFDATGKQYRYFIWNGRAMNPLLRRTAWQVPRPLDVSAMRVAAKSLLGKRDFRSFAANHDYPIEDTIRTLTRCDVRRSGPLITIIIEGDGFLYKMCRGIAGTLAQVGEGKIAASEMESILNQEHRSSAGVTAPAHGLVLWKVYYE